MRKSPATKADDRPRIVLHLRPSGTHGQVLAELLRAGHAEGWNLHVVPSPRVDFAQLAAWGPTAAVARVENAQVERHWRKLRIPVLNVSGYSGDVRLPRIAGDDRATGVAGAEYLLARGFTSLAFVGVPGVLASRLREAGFCDAADRRRIGVRVLHLGEGSAAAPAERWRHEHGREVDFVTSLPRPAGLMCFNDYTALSLLQAARDAGLAVPDDLAVLGVDNTPTLTDLHDPPLSSIEQDGPAMGRLAASTLRKMLAGKPPPDEQRVPHRQIVERASTEVVAHADPVVRDAIRRIRAEAQRGLTVEALLESVPLSRRAFEIRFRKAVGHAPLHEIHRQRITFAQSALLQTDQPITEIALASGFSDLTRFGTAFRKLTGQTASAFRRSRRGGEVA